MVFLVGFNVVYSSCKYRNYKFQNFLAAMSSSRSDVVTKFVCPCFGVSVPFFLLVSLKFLLVLKSFNGVSRQFKGCFN